MPETPALTTPVHVPETAAPAAARDKPLKPGLALCLSGGGYRAMLFHVGVLLRLNEAGLLPELHRVSSVSGGSITAGVLALAWADLAASGFSADTFHERVVEPLQRLAGRTLDAEAVITGALLPGSIGDRVAAAYDRYLFSGGTLQDLPSDEPQQPGGPPPAPRFVINATNIQSAALWRFSRPYMGDYRVGHVDNPTLPLAVAVAASSAFPPILSPVTLDLDPADFRPLSAYKKGEEPDLTEEAFKTEVVLSDGGVYDNMGLETIWKGYEEILVSDAGGLIAPEYEPKRDWGRHAYRVLNIIDNQVRSLRKIQTIEAFRRKERRGAYWGIRTDIGDYDVEGALDCPYANTLALAETATRLKRLDEAYQNRLMNWGYAVCDAALRRHYRPDLAAPADFPFPNRV